MKVCSSCHQTNPAQAVFCQKCASPLGNQSSQSPNQPGWNPPPVNNQGTPQNFVNNSGGASQRAMIAAALAAFGLCCCFAGGVPGAIMGWLEISSIKEGRSSAEGMMMAQIGLWGGIAGAVINAFCWLIFLLFFGAAGQAY